MNRPPAPASLMKPTSADARSRRELLHRCGMGLGALALGDLMHQAGLLAPAEAAVSTHPLTPRQPQFPGKAKRVIHLFMNGGPSQVDTFDPKPALERYRRDSNAPDRPGASTARHVPYLPPLDLHELGPRRDRASFA